MAHEQLRAEVERDVAAYIKRLRALDPEGRDQAYQALAKKLSQEVYEMRRAGLRIDDAPRRTAAAT